MKGSWAYNERSNMRKRALKKAMYHIVIFEKTNEVEVVPSEWISGEECMWPPNKVDVVKAIKSQEQPGEDWKPHRARVIFTSNDYNEARLKLPEAVLHTNLGTDEEDYPIKHKRRRMSKNILFPGEEEDEVEHVFPKAKPWKKKTTGAAYSKGPRVPQPAPERPRVPQPAPERPRVLQPAPVRPRVPQPAPERPRVPQPAPERPRVLQPAPVRPRVPQPAPERPRVLQLAPVRPRVPQPAPERPRVPQPAPARPRVPQPAPARPRVPQPAPALQQNILTNQEMMMDQMKIIFTTVQGLKSATEEDIGVEPNLLPLADPQSIENLEERLRNSPDLKNQLKNGLALNGGGDIKECGKRCSGQEYEHARHKWEDWLPALVIAVRRNRLTCDATDQEIETKIKKMASKCTRSQWREN
ncbi:hypothetical protein ATANTOWER_017279 [Ataeniobius toweri]|uniref:Uncharacterized protein n=1 Tax=Ataeniobius toweri TaxID=208326 RepID=A0ABU7AQ05_9TELE|nr:hypothetical protein [Ataeniobius toweri]